MWQVVRHRGRREEQEKKENKKLNRFNLTDIVGKKIGVEFWFSYVKEGCWDDNPGEGLTMFIEFRGREEDLFCMRELGVSWRTSEVYCHRIENLDWDASCI